MIKTSDVVSDLVKNSKEYIDTNLNLIKLDIAEKFSALLCGFLTVALLIFFFLIASIFIGISVALILSIYTGSAIISFLIVALLYFLIGLVIWIKRDKLIRIPLMNFILSHLFKKD